MYRLCYTCCRYACMLWSLPSHFHATSAVCKMGNRTLLNSRATSCTSVYSFRLLKTAQGAIASPMANPEQCQPLLSCACQHEEHDTKHPAGCPRQKRWHSAGAAVAYALGCLACSLVALVLWRSSLDEQLLTVYNGGLDAGLALKATLQDTSLLWTGNNMTAQEVLATIVPSAEAFVVVTPGPSTPRRRAPDQPFLTCGSGVPLPADIINAAASLVEQALGRHLFPVHITAVDMSPFRDRRTSLVRPYMVWEVGTGTVLVDKTLVKQLWASPKVQHMSGLMFEHLFKGIAGALTTVGQVKLTSMQLSSIMGPALATAVVTAFAAAPPLWFCVVCPAVLGLLAPLLINIGLNQLAGYLCTHMQLPDDQCFDLMLGALGLGFVLALASAIPIFYVCKLQDCARHDNSTGGVQPLQPRKIPADPFRRAFQLFTH